MTTIMEDYVSFEAAKLLKEKEFDWNCITYYVDYEPNDVKYSMLFENNTTWEERCCSAPTLQMVMKWLREAHKIFICIELDAPTFVADIYKIDEIDEYGCAKHIPPTIANCKTYEKAVEAAIKYALENLI